MSSSKKAAPEVVEAVESGEVTVSDAAKVVEAEHGEQRELLTKVRSGKARSLATARGANTPKAPRKEETDMVHDANGKVVPPSLAPIFETLRSEVREIRGETERIRKRLSALKREVTAAEGSRRNVFTPRQRTEWKKLVRMLREAKKLLREYEPHSICESCEGRGCGKCRSAGWFSYADMRRAA